MNCHRRILKFENTGLPSSSKKCKSGKKPKWYSCFTDIRRSLGIGGTPIEVEAMADLDSVPCIQGSVNKNSLEINSAED